MNPEDPIVGVLNVYDLVVFIAYFLIVIGVGIWASCRNRGSVGGYFLAGRSMHWVLVGASLFASNIGSGHFIGLAGSGAAGGIGISVFELNAIFVLMILGWVFVPVYIASGVYTMPEYLRKRFGGQRIRVYLGVLALLLYIFTKISADLYAGAVFIEQSMGLSLYPSVIILLLIAAMFTILGGLTAVIWTDFIQTIIMIIGAVYLMIMAFIKVGGYESLVEKYFQSAPSTSRCFSSAENAALDNITNKYYKCGIPAANSMNLMRSYDDGALPWPGVMFGLTISSIWYWCSDQVIVQRALAAKNYSHAKGGIVLSGWLKLLPMWLIVLPGMAARILFPDEVGCGDPEVCKRVCGKPRGCSDIAYPKLVMELMPSAARGLMLAVMVASLISSLTSIFNSSSTIFTIDIWKRMRPKATDVELMVVGRVFVILMVGVGVAWIPFVKSGGELFHYIQSVTSYLAPPVCAIYLLAILWKRCNESGAFWSLMIGLVIGLIRFIWEVIYPPLACGDEDQDTRHFLLSKVHYLHFGILLFFITLICAIAISYMSAPLPEYQLTRLLFWNRYSEAPRYEGKRKVSVAITGAENLGFDTDRSNSVPNIVLQSSDDPAVKKPNCCKRAVLWICGIENMSKEPEISEEERLAIEAKQNSIAEKPLWRHFNNVMAIILLTATIFFWGFYS